MTRTAEIRHRLGMSQSQFAAKLGVTIRTVSRWDTGKGRPTPAVQSKLDALEVIAKVDNHPAAVANRERAERIAQAKSVKSAVTEDDKEKYGPFEGGA